ncbi:DUF4232 domain-containing protein [Streptomyces sp. NPDC050703]|uniref:DUF4232 domain-containing protein n=1 Tax=Streptomyces sp. NPDC050703 TaxID=3157218 RepID=UPI00343AE9FE
MTVTPRPLRRAVILAVAPLLLAGCGLAAELEREADPAREATTPEAGPSGPAEPSGPAPGPTEPPAAGPCPDSGWRMSPGMVTAAMGLRAMSVTLTNCGTGVREVNGYPDIRVRGLDRRLFAVTVLKGTEPVTSMDDPGPRRVRLRPGQSAYTSLVWRYSAVDAATREGSGVYVDIGPTEGAARQTVEPDGGLDIGETGMLGTTAWQRSPRDDAPAASRPATERAPSTPGS